MHVVCNQKEMTIDSGKIKVWKFQLGLFFSLILNGSISLYTHTHTCVCVFIYLYLYIYIYIYIYSEVGDCSWGQPEGSLFNSYYQGEEESDTPFPRLLHFTLDLNLIMLSVKQVGIKYHFLSLWYDSTWDWTQVSQTISEHSTH